MEGHLEMANTTEADIKMSKHLKDIYDMSRFIGDMLHNCVNPLLLPIAKQADRTFFNAGSMAEGLTYKISDMDMMFPVMYLNPDRMEPTTPGFVRVRSDDTADDETIKNLYVCTKGNNRYISSGRVLLISKTHITEDADRFSHFAKAILEHKESESSEQTASSSCSVPIEPQASDWPNLLSAMVEKATDTGQTDIEELNKAYKMISICNDNNSESPLVVPSLGPMLPNFFTDKNFADNVPCIELTGWPESANAWIARKRPSEWPTQAIISDIVQSGFHLVCKAPPDGDPETEWRLSFSLAEVKLAQNMTTEQRATYGVFKYIIKEGCKHSHVVPSYFLKTVYLWVLEKIPAHQWTEDSYAARVANLIEELTMYLKQKNLPHYFIDDLNLLKDTDPHDISQILKEIQFWKERPPSFKSSSPSFQEKPEFMRMIKVIDKSTPKCLDYICAPLITVLRQSKETTAQTELLLKWGVNRLLDIGEKMFGFLDVSSLFSLDDVMSLEPYRRELSMRYNRYKQLQDKNQDSYMTLEDLEKEEEFERFICVTEGYDYAEYKEKISSGQKRAMMQDAISIQEIPENDSGRATCENQNKNLKKDEQQNVLYCDIDLD